MCAGLLQCACQLHLSPTSNLLRLFASKIRVIPLLRHLSQGVFTLSKGNCHCSTLCSLTLCSHQRSLCCSQLPLVSQRQPLDFHLIFSVLGQLSGAQRTQHTGDHLLLVSNNTLCDGQIRCQSLLSYRARFTTICVPLPCQITQSAFQYFQFGCQLSTQLISVHHRHCSEESVIDNRACSDINLSTSDGRVQCFFVLSLQRGQGGAEVFVFTSKLTVFALVGSHHCLQTFI